MRKKKNRGGNSDGNSEVVDSKNKDIDLNSTNLFNSLIDSINADLVSKNKDIDEKISLNEKKKLKKLNVE